MGRVLLIALVAVLLGACETERPRDRAHADLACAACHQGPQGERGRATVPMTSCMDAGCHEAGGPEEVEVATVTFPHRDHGEDGEIDATCAGCHTHDEGGDPLYASVDACALCHIEDVSTGTAQDCRLCHAEPDHSALTSQGVVVSHAELPWLEIGCVRCHYDVASPATDVSGLSCRGCHEDTEVLNARAVGRDLHPIHEGVTCTSCHQSDVHEVRAMSAVVELVCSDCHTQEHELPLAAAAGAREASDLCLTCHEGIHSAQQRLVLGVRPDSGVTPSEKFLAGITCRSCHISETGPRQTTDPIRGQAESCSGCHPAEYEQVLPWWQAGIEMRIDRISQYHRQARGLGTASDSAAALLETAREMVSLVATAGGQHNLELSDRLLRDAVERIRQAYQAAGRQPPTPPNLGREAHMGLCSYCHYETTQIWNLEDMPEDFHRTVLGRPD